MAFSDENTERVPVELEDGNTIYVEVVQTGRQDVAFDVLKFENVSETLTSIVKSVAEPINKARPTKASVKFGLELGVEQGSLMAALVRGTGTANLEITLEWERDKDK